MFGSIFPSPFRNSVILLFVLLGSCKKEPLQLASESSQKDSLTTIETNGQLLVQLPIKLENTNFIVFPVGHLTNESRIEKLSYSKSDYYNHYLDNLIFQNITSSETHLLASHNVKILRYEQLRDSLHKPIRLLAYEVVDDFSTIESDEAYTTLYISTADGKTFKKLSPPGHQLKNWKYISETSKIYFQTIEDTDGNGKYNQRDELHMYVASTEDFTVEEVVLNELKAIAHLE